MNGNITNNVKVSIIRVLTKDLYLLRKIAIDAGNNAEVIRSDGSSFPEDGLLLVDIDTCVPPENVEFIAMSRRKKDGISIPFPLGAIEKLCTGRGDSPALSLVKEERCAFLHGEKIRLTEVELSLLSSLVSRRGAFASREELLEEVWGNEADGGVINVYVHYLREKLEKRGEKIILSSRKYGYRIDEKYLGGNENA